MKKSFTLGIACLSIAGLLAAGAIIPAVNGGAASTSFTTWTAYSTNKVIQQATRNESFINTGDTVYEGTMISFDNNVVVIRVNLKGRFKNFEVPYENIKKIRLAVKF